MTFLLNTSVTLFSINPSLLPAGPLPATFPPMPPVPAVSVFDLTKRYGETLAVTGLSFEVPAGEIFGLLGPNGAGKTTTVECILGLRRPDSGSIAIQGIDALAHPGQVKRLIGAQLQSTALQDKITPREALAFFASFYDNGSKPNDLLRQFALEQKADAPFDSLSGGQRQRLALALAVINKPRVLFLDEPTAGLDPQSRRELHAVIREIKSAGHTVVLTTHYIEEAHQLCDRLAIIDRGRVIAAGVPDELIASAKTPSRVTFRIGRPMASAHLQSLASVIAAAHTDSTCTLTTHGPTQTVIALIKSIESSGNQLIDLQIHSPTLEDVYLQLTGARFTTEDG